jgi:hypothetical protein
MMMSLFIPDCFHSLTALTSLNVFHAPYLDEWHWLYIHCLSDHLNSLLLHSSQYLHVVLARTVMPKNEINRPVYPCSTGLTPKTRLNHAL